MATDDLTAQRLRELLRYDPEADAWTRIQAHKMRPDCQGQPAGCLDNGYLNIKVGPRKYKAHRLVWLWHTGEWPTGHIDHIDGDRANNRIENLRDAGRHINAQNQKRAHSNNTTGFMGVHVCHGRYMARLSLAGRRIYLGSFGTPEAAYEAYVTAKRQLHPGCTI